MKRLIKAETFEYKIRYNPQIYLYDMSYRELWNEDDINEIVKAICKEENIDIKQTIDLKPYISGKWYEDLENIISIIFSFNDGFFVIKTKEKIDKNEETDISIECEYALNQYINGPLEYNLKYDTDYMSVIEKCLIDILGEDSGYFTALKFKIF